MKDVLGIIDVIRGEGELEILTAQRSLAALPFGGRYRMIDFTLSQMVNSGIDSVGVFTESNCHSLMDHLRYAKDWDLHRRWGGLAIFPPDCLKYPFGLHRGSLEKLSPHVDYLRKDPKKLVLVAETNAIFSHKLEEAVTQHRESGADVTVLWANSTGETTSHMRNPYYKLSSTGRVEEVQVTRVKPAPDYVRGTGVYILPKDLLLQFIEGCEAQGNTCLVRDGLARNTSELHISSHEVKGYTAWIDNMASYYGANMDILKPHIRRELFFENGPIHTKVKVEPPAKYFGQGEAHNSLVASGCLIQGKVENCILFRGVRIEPGVHVKDSILMPKGVIEKNVVLEKAILDKAVTITSGKQLKGEASNPVVVAKNKVV
ncbi:glucose-1-phosphate adenylyltransferase [Desulfitispora alkaliphila]|uniref:glucose-1-phosphate adenylyltransferase subunit GlgD n=1 Tax=Desulfitispora alkaliphila TaxID=622674 RepID=UPI003D242DD0